MTVLVLLLYCLLTQVVVVGWKHNSEACKLNDLKVIVILSLLNRKVVDLVENGH